LGYLSLVAAERSTQQPIDQIPLWKVLKSEFGDYSAIDKPQTKYLVRPSRKLF
jgi:hypothetical protein